MKIHTLPHLDSPTIDILLHLLHLSPCVSLLPKHLKLGFQTSSYITLEYISLHLRTETLSPTRAQGPNYTEEKHHELNHITQYRLSTQISPAPKRPS